MATPEERTKILMMIQEKKISAEQGIQLLQVLDESGGQGQPTRPSIPTAQGGSPETGAIPTGRAGRWFRVMVTDINTGKTRVNVRLPVGLVSAGIKMGARFAPQVEGLDSEQIMAFLDSGETGRIVDVYEEGAGEHVEVFIE
jgi:hypothetical protein